MEDHHENVLFRCMIACAVPFKGVVEALINCHVTVINLVLNQKGISITHIDAAMMLVINILLERPSFQEWYLSKNEIVVGINALGLQKLTKSLTARDTLEITLYEDNPQEIYLRIYNEFSSSVLEHRMKTLLLDHDQIEIPEREFTRTVTLPTSEFSRHIRDLAAVGGKRVFVKADAKELVLTTKTDLCESSAIIKAKKKNKGAAGSITIGLGRRKGPNIVDGAQYSIKYLQNIAKCSLDDTLCLYLSQDEDGSPQPLLARYTISVLGSIVFFLAPENE